MTESIAQDERDREELSRPKVSYWLWFCFAGGPMAGLLMVWINYPLVDRACVGGNRVWLHVASAIFLAIAVFAWLDARRWYVRAGDRPMTEGGVMPRARFMALVGMLSGGLAIIEIVFQWIPVFFLGSCIGT
jgi:hypothetical protein